MILYCSCATNSWKVSLCISGNEVRYPQREIIFAMNLFGLHVAIPRG